MPKEKENLKAKLRRFVDEFGKQVFKTEGSVLFCIYCEKSVTAERRSQVVQHIASQQHLKKIKDTQQIAACSSQLLLGEAFDNTSKKCEFTKDLCYALVGSNIPINKVNSPALQKFFIKHVNKTLPADRTIRNYLYDLYDSTVLNIKKSLANKKIWVSIDETSDIMGRKIANVIVGILNIDEDEGEQHVFLLDCVEMDKANQYTIAKLFDETINLISPDYVKKEDVLIFVSDAAPYMVAAARGIKALYPNLIHVTCLAHALHRVAEQIRCQYADVDKFVSNCKKIFSKAPSRIRIFEEKANGIPLPPQPVITRWGTWLNAVNYYNTNKNLICEVKILLLIIKCFNKKKLNSFQFF